MKPLILAILLSLVTLAHPQEKRDLMEIESTDGKKTSVQLLSATFSQVQFRRLDSDKTFELPLNKLSESTVKAIRAWTVDYNKRTPVSFRQFSLGMPLKTLETMATEGKIELLLKNKSGGNAALEFRLVRGFQENMGSQRILATTESKEGTIQHSMDKISAVFKDGKLVTLVVQSPVQNADENASWLAAMREVLTEKYGPGEEINENVFWLYTPDVVVGITATKAGESFKVIGNMLFTERSAFDGLLPKEEEKPQKTKGKF